MSSSFHEQIRCRPRPIIRSLPSPGRAATGTRLRQDSSSAFLRDWKIVLNDG
jgi:hypothetical protein